MLIQIAKFVTKPEYTEAFKQALIENQQGAVKEDGCYEMRLFQDKKQPNIFFGYERWQDHAALDFHRQQPHVQKVVKMVESGEHLESFDIIDLGQTVPAPLFEKNPNSPRPEDELFIIFFIFKTKDGYREKLIKQFETHVTSTRREEDGNILFDFYTVDGKDDTFAVYEHWRKESDVWDIHFNQPYSKVTGALMEEAVVGDMNQYMNFVTEFGLKNNL